MPPLPPHLPGGICARAIIIAMDVEQRRHRTTWGRSRSTGQGGAALLGLCSPDDPFTVVLIEPSRREGATRVVLRKGRLSLFPMSVIDDLLQKTSRTFALAIPLLPEPTRNQVGIAYLLFRIADTFEDAVLWTRERRLEALGRFVELLDQDPSAAEVLARDCLREPPLEHAGYRELLARMPLVLRDFGALALPARVAIRRHLIRSVDGMKQFVRRSDERNRLTLSNIEDLRDYCYSVAGIVGEMLTELYLLDRAELAAAAEELRNRAASFGEGLQLVNILKDAPARRRGGARLHSRRRRAPRGARADRPGSDQGRRIRGSLAPRRNGAGARHLQRIHRRAGPIKPANPVRARPGREAVAERGRLGRG